MVAPVPVTEINDSIILNLKIIGEVEKRPCLWESEYANLEGTLIVSQAWEEVAYAVNMESTRAKSLWLLLYNNLMYKLQNKHKEDEEYFQELLSWPYFQAMKFLTKTIEDSLFFNKSDKILSQTNTQCHDIADDGDEIKSSPPSTVINGDLSFDRLDEFKSENPYILESESEDKASEDDCNVTKNSDSPICPESDYLYLMTLLPLLEKLPLHRKLKVRIKILEILYNEIYNVNGS